MNRYDGADDEIRTSIPTRNPPSPHDPWIRRLAAAVIIRCFRDAIPRHVANRRDREKRYALQRDAIDWVTNGGENLKYWCMIADVEPGRVRHAVIQASHGVLPEGADLRRYRSKSVG